MTDTKTEVPDVLAMMNAALADIHTEHPDTIPCPAPDRLDAMSEEELVIECLRLAKANARDDSGPGLHGFMLTLKSDSCVVTFMCGGRYTSVADSPREALLGVLRQVGR